VNALQLVRKRPGPRRGIRHPPAVAWAARMARDRRDIERVRAQHAAWVQAQRTSGAPGYWYTSAMREAERQEAKVRASERVLMAELAREMAMDGERDPTSTSAPTSTPRAYTPRRAPRMGRSALPESFRLASRFPIRGSDRDKK
jgi:hypothetical protein